MVKDTKEEEFDLSFEGSISESLQGSSDREETSNLESSARWIDNSGEEIKEVFGFTKNAELINGRVAMFGFFMLIITEIIFNGVPVTKSIFGIG